jgi:hypothetical protein
LIPAHGHAGASLLARSSASKADRRGHGRPVGDNPTLVVRLYAVIVLRTS